jgi:hypothetical protein
MNTCLFIAAFVFVFYFLPDLLRLNANEELTHLAVVSIIVILFICAAELRNHSISYTANYDSDSDNSEVEYVPQDNVIHEV